MEEPVVVDAVKKYIQNLPEVVYAEAREYCFVKNGCFSDVIGYSNDKKIRYIVECKGSGSPGTIAGGIGQAYQYFFQKSFDKKNASPNAEVYFACPEDRRFLLDVMKIPKEITKVLLVKENKDIIIYKTSKNKRHENILQLSETVYLEQFTLKGFICSLKVLFKLGNNERSKGIFEKKFLEKMKIISPSTKISDARNVLIGPRNMGLVHNFKLTPKGYYLYGIYVNSKEEFKKELIKLIYPSLHVILNALIIYIGRTDQKINKFTYTLQDLEKEICKFYDAKEVMFFQYRRLSYPINILKELDILKEYIIEGKKYNHLTKIDLN